MKRKITLLLFSISASFSFSQIPNSGFETWTNMGGYENPNNWGTMNNSTAFSGVFTAERAIVSGSSFIKLTSKMVDTSIVNGIAVSGNLDSITRLPKSGFAFSGMPKSLTGVCQYMSYGGSEGSISASLTKWNFSSHQRDTIATAYQSLPGMKMVWTSFSIDFSYKNGNTPDSCILFLRASGVSPASDDYLWLDSLAFAGNVAAIKEPVSFINNINAYPNPAKKNIEVTFNLIHPEKIKITLTNITGKLIKEFDLGTAEGSPIYSLDINDISNGPYFLNIISESGIKTKQIEIE